MLFQYVMLSSAFSGVLCADVMNQASTMRDETASSELTDDSAFLQLTGGDASTNSFFPAPQDHSSANVIDSTEYSMAKMAASAYKGGLMDILGPTDAKVQWTKRLESAQRSGLVGQDKLLLYQNGYRQCTLVFSGSDDVKDLIDSAKAVFTVPRCGVEVHRGFWEETVQQTSTDDFQNRFKPLLTGSACSRGVYAVGHGLGGAMASVFAGCSMKADGPASIRGIRVAGLFTFGAPSVSRPKGHPGPGDIVSGQLSPDSYGNSCFAGARFFNVDHIDYDPVPPVATVIGFVHPRVKAVKLTDSLFHAVEKTEYLCTHDKTKLEPEPKIAIAVPNPLKNAWGVYLDRTKEAFPGQPYR